MWIVVEVHEGIQGWSVRTYGPYDDAFLAEAARRRIYFDHRTRPGRTRTYISQIKPESEAYQ